MFQRAHLPPLSTWALPLGMAVVAFVAVCLQLDATGDYPGASQGPGLTLDESFNVQQGVYLVESTRMYGPGVVHPDSLREIFEHPGYLPDHPPLGHVAIGLFHELARHFAPPGDHQTRFVTTCGRTASAFAFALTVFLVGLTATRWYGSLAGFAAATSLVLMPRLFGHAHLASLETWTGLMYAASVLSIAHAWQSAERPALRSAMFCGVIFGLALLTKIQAILLPIPIAIWAVAHWRSRAVLPLLVWGGVGFVIFFLGWPWLWLDPAGHLSEYFGRTTDRAVLHVTYFGERLADRELPWHYPWVLFLVTVPLGLHLFGMLGVSGGEEMPGKNRRERLLLGCIAFPLVVFSVPGVAVYDGVRLFLVVFPLWSLFIGRGVALLWRWLLVRLSRRTAVASLSVLLLMQMYGVVAYAPCWLSYYNLAVGGLRGADGLGLQTTYWGDAVTRDLLQQVASRVPAGSVIAVSPVPHQFILDEMLSQSPLLRQRGIVLQPLTADCIKTANYVLFYQRTSDLSPLLMRPPPRAKLVVEVRREGVRLAGLYVLDKP